MFKDQVVWITGASSGIGKGLATQFAKNNAKLILSGRNVAALEQVAQDCGGGNRHMVLPFETTDTKALPNVVAQAIERFGHIDVLVNNAGISQRSLAIETVFPVYQKIIDVDLLAPIALTQLVLPGMAARKAGKIVMISSVAGKVGSPMRTAYSAAKHGLIGYADALRTEVEPIGLSVHVIAPGSIKTDVSRNAIVSDGTSRGESDDAIENGMDPAAAAAQMLRAISRGEREIIIAKGFERDIVRMRKQSPNKLFDLMTKLVAQGYASKMKGEK